MEEQNIIHSRMTLRHHEIMRMYFEQAKNIVNRELVQGIANEIMKSDALVIEEDYDKYLDAKVFTASIVVMDLEEYRRLKRLEKELKKLKEIL